MNNKTLYAHAEVPHSRLEQLIMDAEYLGSPFAESMADSTRLTALINVAQRVKGVIDELSSKHTAELEAFIHQRLPDNMVRITIEARENEKIFATVKAVTLTAVKNTGGEVLLLVSKDACHEILDAVTTKYDLTS